MPPTVTGAIVAESGIADQAMLLRLNTARRGTPAVLGDLPLAVLTRGRGGRPDAHAELAQMSRNGRHVIVHDAYHEIHLSDSDAVVNAVTDVARLVR